MIGVDESGKGDFFGPLVIAAFLAVDDRIADLKEIGVRDSKLISNNRLLQIDRELRKQYPHALVVVQPEEYNDRYRQIKNLNKLLAWGHARAIGMVLDNNSADRAVSDKFGKTILVEEELARQNTEIPLQQIVRAEKIPQVAAASIIARAAFLREIERLSEMCGIELPRGAAPKVDQAGQAVVARYGPDYLRQVAKTHFKNYKRSISPRLLF